MQVRQGIELLIIDFGPLPKAHKESAEQLAAVQADSKAKLLEILAETQHGL